MLRDSEMVSQNLFMDFSVLPPRATVTINHALPLIKRQMSGIVFYIGVRLCFICAQKDMDITHLLFNDSIFLNYMFFALYICDIYVHVILSKISD